MRKILLRIAIPVLAVLGSTVTVNPILGAEPAEELKAIRELLTKIDAKLENQNTISLLMMERLKADFGQLKTDMTQLRDDLAQAKRELADLRGRPNGGTTSSYYGSTAPTNSIMAPSSSVKLINAYLTDMTAFINGRLIVVPPGQTTVVPVAPGTVMYQVTQVQPWAKTTSLSPGEILTLNLYPRQ